MSLVAHYRLEDLTNKIGPSVQLFSDSGALVPAVGKLGNAYQRTVMNSGDDYIGTVEDIHLSGDFTMACWAYVTNAQASANGLVTNHSHTNNSGAGINVRYISSTDYRISCNTGNGSSRTYNTYYGTSNIKDRWAHLLLRYRKEEQKLSLWVDGVKEFEISYGMYCVPDKLQFFKWSTTYSSGLSYRPAAIIDDVRVYDHALSTKEILDLSRADLSYYRLDNSTSDSVGTGLIGIGSGSFVDSDIGPVADVNGTAATVPLEHTPLSLKGETITFLAKCNVDRASVGGGGFSHRLVQWGTYYTANSGGFGILGGEFRAYLRGPNGAGWTDYPTAWAAAAIYDQGGWIRYTIVFRDDDTFAVFMNETKVLDITLSDPYTGIETLGVQLGVSMQAQVSDLRIIRTALTDDQVVRLYKTRASLDENGNLHTRFIHNSNIEQQLNVNWTEWEDGQTGSVGTFAQNGLTSENERIIDNDPWGKPTVVWNSVSSGDNAASGGWNGSHIPIDSSKMYRHSVWIRRPVLGNGSSYLGCYSSTPMLFRSNLSSSTNPYYWANSFPSTSVLPLGEWMLVVAHTWPAGSGAGEMHEESGLYRVSTGKFTNITRDLVFQPETTSMTLRSYLYYATDPTTNQQWCYPRIDVIDGTEPSINELLNGFDSRNEDLWRKTSGAIPGFSVGNITSGNFSEIGITDGLVAYYPLKKDVKDYSGNENHGTAVGTITPSRGGMYFDGTARFDAPTAIPTVGDQEWTVVANVWLEANNTDSIQYLNNYNRGNIIVFTPYNTRNLLYINSGVNDAYTYGSIFPLGEWKTIAFRLNESNTSSSIFTSDTWYETSNYTTTDVAAGIPSTTKFFENFVGYAKDVKIFNRALSNQEIEIEYKLNKETKFTIHNNNKAYVQGEFKEV